MSKRITTISPFLVILFGLFLLFWLKLAEAAGVCLLTGYIIIERVWPEKWGTDSNS